MNNAIVTDDIEIAARTEGHTRAVLALLPLVTCDPLEQAAALLAAATGVIQREVGSVMAEGALMALIEPTVASWRADRPIGQAN